jgi:hypothetical protein
MESADFRYEKCVLRATAVSIGNLIRLRRSRLMLAGGGRSLQIDLVGVCWAFHVSDTVESRESDAASPIEPALPQFFGTYCFLGSGQDHGRWSLRALASNVLEALQIVKPDTVIRWYRFGFWAYWRWSGEPVRPALGHRLLTIAFALLRDGRS